MDYDYWEEQPDLEEEDPISGREYISPHNNYTGTRMGYMKVSP